MVEFGKFAGTDDSWSKIERVLRAAVTRKSTGKCGRRNTSGGNDCLHTEADDGASAESAHRGWEGSELNGF